MRYAMNYKQIGKIIAFILILEAVFMVPAWGISLLYHEANAAFAFLKSQLIVLVAAGILLAITRDAKHNFYAKEGLVTTGFTWIALSLFGALPFWISREIPSYVDAVFETVSGFTTTGSSILTNVEAMDHGLLYWRSFSHWVGGMGVLVFLMAIVPLAGKNEGFTLHILRAESPGPSVGKLVPRMRQTAKILYLIYVVLTVLDVVFLLLGGMSLFDSICHAFGTAGTGGFGVKADSFASYSPYLQNVTTVFMLLFGVNFSCYYLLLLKRVKEVLRDEELHLYVIIVVVSILLITWNISGLYTTIGESLRHAAFQVATVISTTGYATTDFDLWPSFSKSILLFLMLSGACAGSTGGGIKVARLLLLMKSLRRNFHAVLHPSEIRKVRVNGVPVDEKVMNNVNGYLIAYVAIITFSFLLISLDGFSMETNFSAIMATFNNIGPGFAAVGPTCNFSAYSTLSKIVMIFDMLAGRLEILPILVFFSKSTWKKN
ncbi:MAG: TrkH family potassium uptake protein [Solobacterium sp.]|nr:TrkH family potassium uptake protein [Solobacterium sp.]